MQWLNSRADPIRKEPAEIGVSAGFAIPRHDLSRLADEFKIERRFR